MSTNRARSAALILSAFIVWPFLSNAASAAMLLSSTANPSSAAAGDRVRFAATVSNTGPTVQAVALDVLAELGMRYDSSIYPVKHDRYGIPDAPRGPFLAKGLQHELHVRNPQVVMAEETHSA